MVMTEPPWAFGLPTDRPRAWFTDNMTIKLQLSFSFSYPFYTVVKVVEAAFV